MKSVKEIDFDLAAGSGPAPTPTLRLPNAVADFERSEIRHDNGHRTELSVREAQLLRFLADNEGRPVSRDDILRGVWRLDPRNLITRTIDMHIAHLRTKINEPRRSPKVLLTVRGEGYMFAGVTAGLGASVG